VRRLRDAFPDQDVRIDGLNGAVFSADGRYRYCLWRVWDPLRPTMNVIGLNPSTADHLALDPTTTRCRARAERLGYGGYVMTNLFALRSTDPRGLLGLTYDQAVGGRANDAALREMARGSGLVVAAWGALGGLLDRERDVLDYLSSYGVRLYCLGLTKNGHPRHPLYLSKESPLSPFTGVRRTGLEPVVAGDAP
jgi:hypothetical protein